MIYQCVNSRCEFHTPGPPVKGRVRYFISVSFPMDENEREILDAPERVEERGFICGLCHDKVNEVNGRDLIKVKIDRVENSWFYGRFLTATNKMNEFVCDPIGRRMKTKHEASQAEVSYLISYCVEQYEDNAIEVELLDFNDDVYLGVVFDKLTNTKVHFEYDCDSHDISSHERTLSRVEEEKIKDEIERRL